MQPECIKASFSESATLGRQAECQPGSSSSAAAYMSARSCGDGGDDCKSIAFTFLSGGDFRGVDASSEAATESCPRNVEISGSGGRLHLISDDLLEDRGLPFSSSTWAFNSSASREPRLLRSSSRVFVRSASSSPATIDLSRRLFVAKTKDHALPSTSAQDSLSVLDHCEAARSPEGALEPPPRELTNEDLREEPLEFDPLGGPDESLEDTESAVVLPSSEV